MASDSENASTNPFWNFSLEFYAQPGVADICISLQDKHHVDVNVMLYMLWLATVGMAVSKSDVVTIDQHIKPWRENVVVPLRHIRRSIAKPKVFDERMEFRNRVKNLELHAERLEQGDLFSLFSEQKTSKPDVITARNNLETYARYLGSKFDDDIGKLLAVFTTHAKA